jgi:hypothetical protein
VDYFTFKLVPGAVVHAETFVGTPGSCIADADTVLSLWKAPVPAGTVQSGACDAVGALDCSDDDPGRAALDSFIGHPESEQRAAAQTHIIATVRHDRAAIGEVISSVAARQFEHDPVQPR